MANAAKLTHGQTYFTADEVRAEGSIDRISRDLATAAARKSEKSLRLSLGALKKSLSAQRRGDYREAALQAAEAADHDPKSSTAFHLLAIALEHVGQTAQAIKMYERAVALKPDDPDLYLNIGLCAFRMGLFEQSERATRLYIQLRPHCQKGYVNLGGALREQGRFDEAVEMLRAAIMLNPTYSDLWNAMGALVGEMSDWENAVVFYREAIRLSPQIGRYWHNLGYALLHTGAWDESLKCFDNALERNSNPADLDNIVFARGLCLLARGDLVEGWRDYEARITQRTAHTVKYLVPAPLWSGEDLQGKTLLLIGEQGLGDEVMFAECIPDVIDRLGPNGKLLLACENRLVPLFQRSFPSATVGPQYNSVVNATQTRLAPWASKSGPLDFYAPIGAGLAATRPNVASFGRNGAYLKPNPETVQVWRKRLDEMGPGLKIGVCWRSQWLNTQRKKFYSQIELWAKALNIPGLHCVNLQYGDCAAELQDARDNHGLMIANFDDLDLKNDLDGNAALCAALDLVISAPTAAAALAAATGTETWFLVASAGWPQLGTDHYPWYAKSRVFMPKKFGDWPSVMTEVADALRHRTAQT